MQKSTPKMSQAQQDAISTLAALKIPKTEAEDLVKRSPGKDASELATNAIRLRAGRGPVVPEVTPSIKPMEPKGAIQAAPLPQQPSPQTQQQIPGFGPPGGAAAAPPAEQLQTPPPPPAGFLRRLFQPAPMKPSWYTGSTVPLPPIRGRHELPPQPAPAPPAIMPPAPIKPRVRVRAAGGPTEAPTPTEAAQAKEI